MAPDVARVINDHRLLFARRWAQTSADLLQKKAQAVCWPTEQRTAHAGHVRSFADHLAAAQNLHLPSSQPVDKFTASGSAQSAVYRGGAHASRLELFCDGLGVGNSDTEGDGRSRCQVLLIVGHHIPH